MGKQDDLRQVRILYEAGKKRRLRKVGGVIVTEKAAQDYRATYCGGCGGAKAKPKLYFGEEFCGECVEKWRSGFR